jgi:GNAT superfamily N-acetyltransferase
VVRWVRDRDELVATFLAIGRQFSPPFTAGDRRLEQPLARFDSDRDLMLCVDPGDGQLGGGVIAFGDDLVTVRAIGLDPALRGRGLGRRLLTTVEAVAMRRGARTISLGAAEGAAGFYERLGYRGKHSMRSKDLPPPGALRDRRAAALLEAVGLEPSA